MFRCPPFLRSMNLVGSCYFDIIADVVASLVVAVSFSLSIPRFYSECCAFPLNIPDYCWRFNSRRICFSIFVCYCFFFAWERQKQKECGLLCVPCSARPIWGSFVCAFYSILMCCNFMCYTQRDGLAQTHTSNSVHQFTKQKTLALATKPKKACGEWTIFRNI